MTTFRRWSDLAEVERVAVRQAYPSLVWAALNWRHLDGRWLYHDPR